MYATHGQQHAFNARGGLLPSSSILRRQLSRNVSASALAWVCLIWTSSSDAGRSQCIPMATRCHISRYRPLAALPSITLGQHSTVAYPL
ncbi:hypothetical protein BDN72DRAFT_151318 [Pluteus cervinus]|uniref:Uncharacterized protein n=1 Tax=Pluteus cervinus TaxID=181527 RepID=A0ACD3B7X2_9AGAR|nr:hypothetical protein BDN72DRAFT_151318 [Pluteus cervinus]